MTCGLVSTAAVCPQGCRNGGSCVAPGICSCPDGWVGGACHTGEGNHGHAPFSLLPVCLHLYVYLPVKLSVCLYPSLPGYLSVSMSVSLSAYLFDRCQHVSKYFYINVYLYTPTQLAAQRKYPGIGKGGLALTQFCLALSRLHKHMWSTGGCERPMELTVCHELSKCRTCCLLYFIERQICHLLLKG